MSSLTGVAACAFPVLVTAASGFIRGPTRRTTGASWAVLFLLHLQGKDDEWWALLARQTVVLHTAVRTHVLDVHRFNPLAELKYANVATTLRLAEKAMAIWQLSAMCL